MQVFSFHGTYTRSTHIFAFSVLLMGSLSLSLSLSSEENVSFITTSATFTSHSERLDFTCVSFSFTDCRIAIDPNHSEACSVPSCSTPTGSKVRGQQSSAIPILTVVIFRACSQQRESGWKSRTPDAARHRSLLPKVFGNPSAD